MQTQRFTNLRKYLDELHRVQRVHLALNQGGRLLVHVRQFELSRREAELLR